MTNEARTPKPEETTNEHKWTRISIQCSELRGRRQFFWKFESLGVWEFESWRPASLSHLLLSC